MAELVIKNMVKTLNDRERSFKLTIPKFTLKSGDKKAIIGTTGSGKTTAMDLLALASRPAYAERFEIHDKKHGIINLSPKAIPYENAQLAELRAYFYGYVVQTSPLFSFLSVRENVAVQQKLAKRPDEKYIMALLKAVGLAQEADAKPQDLSIGQRQRTAIARALSHRPQFLMCDEPTGALDDETADLCLKMITTVAKAAGTGILMITHDKALAMRHGFDLITVTREHVGLKSFEAVMKDSIKEKIKGKRS